MKNMKKRGKLIFYAFILILALSLVDAFDFYGTTKYINGSTFGGVNVSLEIYNMAGGPGGGPSLNKTYSVLSNLTTGSFNISVNDSLYGNSNFTFKPVLIKYNSSNSQLAEYISQSSPNLPYQEFSNLGNTTFYLREAVTLYLSGRGDQVVMSDIIYGDNYSLGNDYSTGLEIINDTQAGSLERWAYINSSDCLVVLNSSLALNFSICNLNITNITDFEYYNYPGEDSYYFLNSTQVERCYVSNQGTSLNCNTTYNINVGPSNFTEVMGIENIEIQGQDYFFISGTNDTDSHQLIKKFYPNFTYVGMSYEGTFSSPPGKMQSYQGSMITVGNHTSGRYVLYKCGWESIDSYTCEPYKNFTQNEIVKGISYNPFDGNWYYSSLLTKNATQISFLTNSYPFRYQIKDTRLGYPIKENFNSAVYSASIYLPADRNYSIMIYPDNVPSFPVRINLNNISSYYSGGVYYVNLSNLNLTTDLIQVSGYIIHNSSLSQQNYTNLTIVAYLLEAGNMVFKGATLPSGMGAWDNPPVNDTFNLTTGYYNITLPAAALGSNLLLFASGSVNNSGTIEYLGSFRNITLIYGSNPGQINFTLYSLIGNYSPLSTGYENDPSARLIPTKQKIFRFINGSGNLIESLNAHIEIEVDYSDILNITSFSWMIDTSVGNFSVPLLNHTIKKINVFSPQYSPREYSLSLSELQVPTINLTLKQFKPIDPDNESDISFLNAIRMMMYKSSDECSVPNPPQSCYLIPSGEEMNITGFNPLSVVLGGSKIDFEIKKSDTNITVKYINVDLLASGPPDAMFDSEANSSSSGNAIEEAWRFGSLGPDMYDYVLVGVPYNSTTINSSMTLKINITRFYSDENLDTSLWVQGTNSTTDLNGTDYEDYLGNYEGYISGSGVLCNSNDPNLTSGLCYRDLSNSFVWFKIPHFSGIQPKVLGIPPSNEEESGEEEDDDGGGSGGGEETTTTTYWKHTYIINENRFSSGYTKKLKVKERIRFEINNEQHSVGIINISSSNVIINVSSTPQQRSFASGEQELFEVTGDNIYDVLVKLNSIEESYANITVKKVAEVVPETTPIGEGNETSNETMSRGTEKAGEETIENKKELIGKILKILALIICIVIILLVIFFIIYLKFFSKEKEDKESK